MAVEGEVEIPNEKSFQSEEAKWDLFFSSKWKAVVFLLKYFGL